MGAVTYKFFFIMLWYYEGDIIYVAASINIQQLQIMAQSIFLEKFDNNI